MKNNSLRKIEKIVLKVLSLIIAIGLWIFISYTLNPEITKNFNNVDIKYIMPEDNSIVILNEHPLTCDIELKGKRNDIIAMSKDDIKLDVDLRYVTTRNKNFKLEVKYPVKKNLSLVKQEYETINLELDDYVNKMVPVNYVIDDLSKEDEKLLAFKIYPKNIKVSGAKSEVDKIKSFYLKFSIDDILKKKDDNTSKIDITNVPNIELFKPESTSLNKEFIKYGDDKVTLECLFLISKKVNLICDKNYLDSDYLEIASQSLSSEQIEIVGASTVLNSIDEIKCQPILDQEVSSAGAYKFLVDIELPSDVKVLSKQDVYLDVTVKDKLDESEL